MTGLPQMSCPALGSLPALDLKANVLGGVYFIQQGKSGPIKIGWSRNVRSRLAALQTATHERLHLLLVLAGKPEDERRLHAWFAHDRQGGEWFRPDGEVRAFIAAKLAPPPSVETSRCDGQRLGEPCWGEVRRYGIDDDFCEGHWEARNGHGYLPEPPRLHGDRFVVDEMGRACTRRCPEEPCWGDIERVGDADDTYCKAHHPVDGVYAAVYNRGAEDAYDPGPPRVPDLHGRLVALENRISDCIHQLGKREDCNGPDAVKDDLWDLLTTVETLRKQAGGEL